MYYGARFLQVHDRFSFSNPFTDLPGPGQDQFSLGIDNNIIGPEIGTRWSNKRGRWTFDSQVRFMPGANFEDSNEYGAMATGTFPLHNFYKARIMSNSRRSANSESTRSVSYRGHFR